METSYKLRVNGREHVVSIAADTPRRYVLRNDLALNGPKFGCGLAQWGACAVLKDGREIRSSVTPITPAVDSNITTSAGRGPPDCLHPLETALVEKQAAQCRYGPSGMSLAAVDLLRSNPQPTQDEIDKHLPGHLCRCGSHLRIIAAIVQAAGAEVPI
jgi:nicotinate dehydrogenase subunit A